MKKGQELEYVLDSSVIVKWFSSENEESRDRALYLLNLYKNEKVDLYIPELAFYEIANALRYNKNFSEKEVRNILKYLFDLDLFMVNMDENIIDLSLEIAYEDNITAYDAVFIALANVLKIPLITANPGHQKKANKDRKIVLLKDF
ncbi:MAG: type II toxin-antitoxin system VapC family toxin [Actinobacteria bacterium]|nr:type II toxin-antitoxin system VapC family toxin [Actinomycetota bacterium]